MTEKDGHCIIIYIIVLSVAVLTDVLLLQVCLCHHVPYSWSLPIVLYVLSN